MWRFWWLRLIGVSVIEGERGIRLDMPRWWPRAFAENFIKGAQAKLVSGPDAHMIQARRTGDRTLVVEARDGVELISKPTREEEGVDV